MSHNKDNKPQGKLVVCMDSLTNAHLLKPAMRQAAQAVAKATPDIIKKAETKKTNHGPTKHGKQ